MQTTGDFNRLVVGTVSLRELAAVFPPNTAFRCTGMAGIHYLFDVFFLIRPDGTPYRPANPLQIGAACPSQGIFIPGRP